MTTRLNASPRRRRRTYPVPYTRYREDGSVIGVYDSLYLLSLLGSACKIQSRSSFGP
ncbi:MULTISPECIES: hypothetical protein [unclassified Bradyrhizobium]|uniref:hypothetical protein n=1 Tax=unclassified Bradyrhizobium TaxID=2631580 RepID=UPI00247AF5E5|nr:MULTISPECIES: hypothetical protein [unclassified Bradyrhizobium]WGS18189.1 hypothetical protein MTX22_26840 [Bradyrhizobium sp. ISRA463]WGS25003.1 hypothetical protein MTX19_24460 [Bradyrhizobium sp. ISRA464]